MSVKPELRMALLGNRVAPQYVLIFLHNLIFVLKNMSEGLKDKQDNTVMVRYILNTFNNCIILEEKLLLPII